MTDSMRVYAGECTAEYEGTVDRTARGHVVALVKPDDTVLVHDRDGYSPAVWLTRPASLDVDHGDGPRITAVDGDQRLTVRFHGVEETFSPAVSVAGVPVGSTAGETDRPFVRNRGSVVDLTTGNRYALSAHSAVLNARCECGLPLIRVERTADDQRCLDPACERAE